MAWTIPILVACSTFGTANGNAFAGGRYAIIYICWQSIPIGSNDVRRAAGGGGGGGGGEEGWEEDMGGGRNVGVTDEKSLKGPQ